MRRDGLLARHALRALPMSDLTTRSALALGYLQIIPDSALPETTSSNLPSREPIGRLGLRFPPTHLGRIATPTSPPPVPRRGFPRVSRSAGGSSLSSENNTLLGRRPREHGLGGDRRGGAELVRVT